jgi:lipoyl(octanoyl) transferase 2
MVLQHLHIPVISRHGGHSHPTYALAVKVQSWLQRRILDYKASLSGPDPLPPPPPTLLSFTPAPTYTLGRRQTEPLSHEETVRLAAPLTIQRANQGLAKESTFVPAIEKAPRGGLATYHGPGQIVFWPVIDLHSSMHRHFGVRDYACLLEKTTITALDRFHRGTGPDYVGVKGITTENPGVWVRTGDEEGGGGSGSGEERKIAALGVHLRRHVTGLGVAINFNMPVTGPETVNPWARIIACGLDDKAVTSLAMERNAGPWRYEDLMPTLRQRWAADFNAGLGARSDPEGSADVSEQWLVVDENADSGFKIVPPDMDKTEHHRLEAQGSFGEPHYYGGTRTIER